MIQKMVFGELTTLTSASEKRPRKEGCRFIISSRDEKQNTKTITGEFETCYHTVSQDASKNGVTEPLYYPHIRLLCGGERHVTVYN